MTTFAIALLMGAWAAQAAPEGPPANIQGTIFEVGTSRTIDGARVTLHAFASVTPPMTTISDLTGGFVFSQVPAGHYTIRIEADNFLPAGAQTSVTINGGKDAGGLKIEMRATGIISGRVYDENGDPFALAEMELMTVGNFGNQRMLLGGRTTTTDDRGAFRFPGLAAGDYYIRFARQRTGIGSKSYQVTYYPNTPDPAAAAKIVVDGQEISGIDLNLAPGGVKLRGQVVSPAHDEVQAALFLIPRSAALLVFPSALATTRNPKSDGFEIAAVSPGSYYLYAAPLGSSSKGPQWTRMPIEVERAEINDITLVMQPPGRIKGHLIVAKDAVDATNLDLSAVTITSTFNEPTPYIRRPDVDTLFARVTSAGQFEFIDVPEGTLFIRDVVLPSGWFISGMRLDGRDVMRSGFSAIPGKESLLEVEITNRGGAVSGVVKDGQDKTVPGARLLLLPDLPLRANPSLVRTVVADGNGEYTIDNVLAGSYTIVAFPDEDKFIASTLRNVETIERYERFGETVDINAGQNLRINLTTVVPEFR